MKFETNYTRVRTGPEERDWGISQTIPGETLTVREIYNKFRLGQPIDHLSKLHEYDDFEIDFDDPVRSAQMIDLSEIDEVADKINMLQASVATKKKVLQKDRLDAKKKESEESEPIPEEPIEETTDET